MGIFDLPEYLENMRWPQKYGATCNTQTAGREWLYGHGYLHPKPYDDFPRGGLRLLRKPRPIESNDEHVRASQAAENEAQRSGEAESTTEEPVQ